MERQDLIKKKAEVENFVESITSRDHDPDQNNLHQALVDYAIKHAGTATDIDPDL